MSNRLHGVSVPHMSQEAYEKVCRAFKPRSIKDTDTLILVGRLEGHREVLEYLKQFVSDSYVSGDQKDLDIQEQVYSPTQRLFKGLKPNES